jgi:hypothetical protein
VLGADRITVGAESKGFLWCLGSVVDKADRRGNLYPTKSRPDQKMDVAVAPKPNFRVAPTGSYAVRNPNYGAENSCLLGSVPGIER